MLFPDTKNLFNDKNINIKSGGLYEYGLLNVILYVEWLWDTSSPLKVFTNE